MSRKKEESEMEFDSKKNSVPRKELRAKIRNQMEFYFGDENLTKDKYLRKLIDEDPWVDLKMFSAFRKIKNLTTDVNRIAKALKKSPMLDVSEDGTKVRRTTLVRDCNKTLRAKDYELSSYASPNSLLRNSTLEDCDEQVEKDPILNKEMKDEKMESENCVESNLKKDSRLQVLENRKKKKRKLISIEETASADKGLKDSKKSENKRDNGGTNRDPSDFVPKPPEMEIEHKSKKRRGKNSENLNAYDGNYALDNSYAAESKKKRKKIKHKPSELESTKPSVQKIKTLPEEETCNPKKRKISDSTAGANDTGENSENINAGLKNEKESDSESVKEVPPDKVKVKKKKKKKRERNLKKRSGKENLGASDFENLKAFRAKDCELSSHASLNSLLSSTTLQDHHERIEKELILKRETKEKKAETENCVESDSKKDSKSQSSENEKKKKKKKKKLISIDEIASADEGHEDSKKSKNKRDNGVTYRDPSDFVPKPPKMEKEHKSKKRKERNLESLNASKGNYELYNSSAAECNKKRKKIKDEASESDQEMKTLSKEEICTNLKKRKISDSTAGANDTGKDSRNVNTELKKEKESDSESIKEVPYDKVKVKKQKKKKRERNLKEETRKENNGDSDSENLEAFRTKVCEPSSHTSLNSLLRITTLKDYDEHVEKESIKRKKIKEERLESGNCVESDLKNDSRLQVPENVKKKKRKKKKKLISTAETASENEGTEDSKMIENKRNDNGTNRDLSDFAPKPPKVEKEHKSKKRSGSNSESLNASDRNYEIDNSSAVECRKKRKKTKHEASESGSAKQSVQEMKTLPEEEICNNLKKRKISDSTARANDTVKNSSNVDAELKKEKESDSESIKEVPYEKVKVKKEKKKKRGRNPNEETRKENLSDSETGLEIMGNKEREHSRTKYLKMQRCNVDKIDADKEESSKKYVVNEEKPAEISFTSMPIVNIETEPPGSDPEKLKEFWLGPSF